MQKQIELPIASIRGGESELRDYIAYDTINMYQQPILLMKMLALYLGENENGEKGLNDAQFVALILTPLLDNARKRLIDSNFGGINAPHYPETYYILSHHVLNSNFNSN